jgi:hypothetical protein
MIKGIKLARKWAYMRKGVPKGKAIVLSAQGNFHGRTIGVVLSFCPLLNVFFSQLYNLDKHEQ